MSLSVYLKAGFTILTQKTFELGKQFVVLESGLSLETSLKTIF